MDFSIREEQQEVRELARRIALAHPAVAGSETP